MGIIDKLKSKLIKIEKMRIDMHNSTDSENYLWIDEFISNVREYIFIREDEKLLIILPNQVYQLNETAVYLLSFLLSGKSIKKYIEERCLSVWQIRDICNFICDLRSFLMGCFRENQERRAVEYVPYNRYFYNYPILSEIAVTYRCNASCEFCYIDGKDKVEELLTEEMKIILFKIKEEAKVPSVSFTGGEPTLRADLFELIKYARSINLRVNLITNGVNIDERYARLLKDAGLNSVQISLESGDKDEHEYLTKVKGSFNKVLSAIKYIKDNGIFVHTNTTINRLNKQSLAKLVDISKELGTNRLSMNMLMPCGNAANNKDLWVSYTEIGEIVREVGFYAKEKGVEFMWYSPTPFCIFNPVEYGLGNKTCAAAHGLLSVNPLGDILPCSSLNISLGNLLKNNFDEIWFSKKALYYRMLEFAPSSCKSCSLFYVCGAGCPIYFEKVGLSEIMDKSISR